MSSKCYHPTDNNNTNTLNHQSSQKLKNIDYSKFNYINTLKFPSFVDLKISRRPNKHKSLLIWEKIKLQGFEHERFSSDTKSNYQSTNKFKLMDYSKFNYINTLTRFCLNWLVQVFKCVCAHEKEISQSMIKEINLITHSLFLRG